MSIAVKSACRCLLIHHAFTSARPDNWKEFCAACYVQRDVKDPFFLCASCLRKLPDDIRRPVLSSENRDQQRGARRTALEFLGAIDVNDVRMPPPPRTKGEGCRHDEKFLYDQPNMITGATDRACNKCGKVRYAPTKNAGGVIA